MTNMKFKIKNLKQYKALQRILFKLGYSWGLGGMTIDESLEQLNIKFMYAEGNKLYKGFSYARFEDDSAVEKDTQKFIAEHTKVLKRKQ